jgi:hypothetical protein
MSSSAKIYTHLGLRMELQELLDFKIETSTPYHLRIKLYLSLAATVKLHASFSDLFLISNYLLTRYINCFIMRKMCLLHA